MKRNKVKQRRIGRPTSGNARRRKLSNGFRFDMYPGPALGDGVVTASPEELVAALEEIPKDLTWKWASSRVLPMLPRMRPWPGGSPEPLITVMPPGIAVGFGVDIGPGCMAVSAPLLESWSQSPADLAAAATVNLHARAAEVVPSDVYRGSIADVPTAWLQTGRSIGSTLILAPAELTRLFGPEPLLLLAPMRDLLIGLPTDVDPELATWLYLEIAGGDPNCLGPSAFRLDGGTISPGQLFDSVGPLRAAPGTARIA